MKYLLLVCLIGLGLTLITFGFAPTTGNPLASLDPHHPAALVLNIESNLRTFGSAARELARGLLEEFTNPYRERFQRNIPSQPPLR
jgi:hypothetical protein